MSKRFRRIGWRDHALGLALSVAYVLLLVGTASDIGMSRDEGFYVEAADRYGAWFLLLFEDPDRALTREVISAPSHWGYNNEHPSLAKSMFALFHLADERWDLFDEPSTGYRFFGMLCGGLLLWLVYIFGARAYGRQAGAFAAVALALMPRVFYHSHLNAFDVPIVLMMTLVTYCYWRALTNPRWAVLTGITYGLALATKHNAWQLPLVFLVHFAYVVWTELRARRAPGWVIALAVIFPLFVPPVLDFVARRRGTLRRVSLVPWWLVGMALLGPPIFVGLWPWLWFDTVERFGAYAGFHLNHAYYNMAYFGVNYFRPPFPMGYPWVMTLFTVPLVTVALGLAGVGARLRALLPPGLMERVWPEGRTQPDPARTDVLAFGSMLAPIVVISMPWTPIFGGTKHWLGAYPFLALFAGIAFVSVARAARRALGEKPFAKYATRVGAASLLLAPAAVETVHSHPFGLSHYGFAAGGVPGAADHGMNRQFWGFTTRSLVDWFEARMPAGGTVWICDTTWTAFQMLYRDGHLDRRIRATGDLVSADYAIVHHEHHFVEVDYQIWAAWGSVQPVHVLTYDGVPIISVYENPRRRR
ncbi:MAG TPA: glycosyltransferase family 39 protein [Sandaracinaceae bacterium]